MRLRIAQISGPWLGVPPVGYGGSETMVAHIADGLVERGHDVTLFAPPNSRTRARLESFYPDELGMQALVEHWLWQIPPLLQAYGQAERFDVIHDHTFPIGPITGYCVPDTLLVHTAHGAPTYGDSLSTYEMIARRYRVVAVSRRQRATAPSVDFAAVIHNGIDLAAFPFREDKGDHLVFVGRMCPEKGVDIAIEVARRCGRELRIAAKMREPDEIAYFREVIEPRLSANVMYIGEVSGPAKSDLFGGAAATLVTGRWDEPFGLVMAESLACGTPVVATVHGAAPELIQHGLTGFLAPDVAGLAAAVDRLGEIDRAFCRKDAEQRFGRDLMVDRYEQLYLRALAGDG
ncbi:MAG TPA: glycosyltransferase family 4 protein [Micromonosporaceae bacterium]